MARRASDKRYARTHAALTIAHMVEQLNINVSAARPDFFLSNCHKWLYAKRGWCALYGGKRRCAARKPYPHNFTYAKIQELADHQDIHPDFR